jgi:3',5'-nucleoside bisphosphate phosphatase
LTSHHIDLHLHSNMSDGVLTPTRLVETAAEAGLKTISLCDHDTVAGVAEAISAGNLIGLEVIPGVELSVSFMGLNDIHLLGYFIDIDSHELLKKLSSFAERRANRNVEIVEKINKLLEKSNLEIIVPGEAERFANGVLGRPHIARALMAKGYVRTMEEAFQKFLIPCNVPKLYWEMEDAISTVHKAGGIAVLAHPTTVTKDRTRLAEIIRLLQGLELDGIEVYNALGSESEMTFLQGITRQLGLIATAGSDFHGIEHEDRIGKGRGGIRFSEYLLPPIRKLAAIRAAQ